MSIKPILFNTDMVQAILDGRKTVTRRVVKRTVWENFVCEGEKVVNWLDKETDTLKSPVYKAPYHQGDILYVRETWHKYTKRVGIEEYCGLHEFYGYKASIANSEDADEKWRPSIHMPKQAARIWLKVTDVRVERLQNITISEVLKEGCANLWINEAHPMLLKDISGNKNVFTDLWNSTIKKADIEKCSWDADPWVWMIEFERCEKPEEGLLAKREEEFAEL